MIQSLKEIDKSLTPERMQVLTLLLQKEYSSEALSFIQNHHRILNYWAAGEADLLPPLPKGEKRRTYSFFDLVWLGIVKELRDFGLEKERIAVLKAELLSLPDLKGLVKQLKSERKELESLLERNYGVGSENFKELLSYFVEQQAAIQELSYSALALYILNVLGSGGDVRLLVGKDGRHEPLTITPEGESLHALSDVYRRSHLSLSLREIMAFFVSLPQVSDQVKQKFVTPKEWALIERVRQEKPERVVVTFSEEREIKLVEMTRKKKVSIEARLLEILAKGGYQKIEIVTQAGTISHALITEKIKL